MASTTHKLKMQRRERTARNALKSYLSQQLQKPVNINLANQPELELESTRRILLKDDDIFKLSDVEEEHEAIQEESPVNYNNSMMVEENLSHFQNLDAVDFQSQSFKSLPAEIRHEILIHLKERCKGWTKISDFPTGSTDFSTYQMGRLLRKRQLQENIEKVKEEMENSTKSDMCFEFTSSPLKCRRMMSDENTHLVYVEKSKQKPDYSEAEKIGNENLKKSSDIFADVSEFDFGKREAIKQDKSCSFKNKNTFSSIKTTKILRQTLNNDLKRQKVALSATSNSTSSENN